MKYILSFLFLICLQSGKPQSIDTTLKHCLELQAQGFNIGCGECALKMNTPKPVEPNVSICCLSDLTQGVSMATDTLIISGGSIHFITIDGQTFEIKRSVTLEPVQKNKSWLTTPSGVIIGGSGTPSLIQLSHK